MDKINNPIEREHTGKGKARLILTSEYAELSNRQEKILEKIPNSGDKIILPKTDINMGDLSALTAKTGDEFAMFTKGNERLIVRGNSGSVDINIPKAEMLASEGYKFSGHTHPGTDISVCVLSKGDIEIMQAFGQSQSVIYNSVGESQKFGKGE
ncbi:MAG: hypothetical protein LBL93_02485 [Ruminococcus sp.]|jgi:hypothetical protein|nr:hypothetical protein [Ruminococcus sp.]